MSKILPAKIEDLAQLFKILGDPTRAKIISFLAISPQRVTDIVEYVGKSQSAISHQLKTLKDYNLVIGDKHGQEVIYKLADNHIITIYQQAMSHICE